MSTINVHELLAGESQSTSKVPFTNCWERKGCRDPQQGAFISELAIVVGKGVGRQGTGDRRQDIRGKGRRKVFDTFEIKSPFFPAHLWCWVVEKRCSDILPLPLPLFFVICLPRASAAFPIKLPQTLVKFTVDHSSEEQQRTCLKSC